MRIRKIAVTRRISKGEISLETADIKEFFRQHEGKAVIVRIELLPVEPSEKAKAYYWKVIVPTIQRCLYERGYDLTKRETDEFLRDQMPVCKEETYEGGKLKERLKEVEELDAAELNEMIEQIKIWAADNLEIYVEEASII
jgi:hypothetical protein